MGGLNYARERKVSGHVNCGFAFAVHHFCQQREEGVEYRTASTKTEAPTGISKGRK